MASTSVNRLRRPTASHLLFGLSFVLVGGALIQLALVRGNPLGLTTLMPLLVLVACSGTVLFALRRFRPRLLREVLLLPLVFLLSGLGLVMIDRLAPAFVSRQLLWLVLATGLLLMVALVPRNLNWLYRYKYSWLIGGLILLASTLIFGVNPSGFGARLWLQVGTIFFQPSELLKLLVVVFLAAYLSDRRHYLINARAYLGPLPIPHPAYLGPMLLMWGFSMVLLIWQQDLGAALLFFGTFLGMLYAATGQTRYLWAGGGLLALAAVIGYAMFDVVRLRVDGFLNPLIDPSGRSFQIIQSLLAFASGGIFGEGLGQGLPTAIPVVHTDFVFAAIAEEYGLLGGLGVVILFTLLIGRAFHIGLRASTDFEQLLAAGIGTMIGLQTFVIMAGTLKLLPLTGVTLPFVSYGGSSLVVTFFMMGLLLFIAGGADGNTRRLTDPPIRHLRLAQAIFAGLLVVVGGMILWQIALAPLLLTRPENPRPIVAEQRVNRGQLLTRGGVPVAETIIGQDGFARRRYPYPNLSSVTGYYSIRYGVGGTEAAFDPILRGTADLTSQERLINELLHQPLIGDDVTLTIDLPAQVTADIALGDSEGAVVVLDLDTGAVLVMSSHPTYDPNTLDQQWDSLRSDSGAPLLNRATQGLFPIGDLARLVAMIGLLEVGAVVPDELLVPEPEMLAQPLGAVGYAATARQLGLIDFLPGLPSQPGRLPNLPPVGDETVRELAVTPLHLARLMAAVAIDGQLPEPVLLLNRQSRATPAMRPDTARLVRARLPEVVDGLVGLSGQASPEETGQLPLSWFVGLAPAQAMAIETVPSAALADGTLILDPTLIPARPATLPTPVAPQSHPRYAVVSVVVTETPETEPALRIARSVVNRLLTTHDTCCD